MLTSGSMQVHKIAQLDLRLVNLDRNGSNILASRTPKGWRLTPIDHSEFLMHPPMMSHLL